jgi:hypothetical protein
MKLVMIRSCVNRVRSGLATLLVSATLFGQALHSAAAAEVEILRDPWGIPHVFAAAESDGFFGLGYAAAEDRLLYGTDADQYTAGREPTAEEKAAFVTRMESWYRRDFDYYPGQGTRTMGKREVECLGLPRSVLEKFFHRNAQRLMPGLKGD